MAKRMACLSNLKQIGTACSMDVVEDKGATPRIAWRDDFSTPKMDTDWRKLISPYLGEKRRDSLGAPLVSTVFSSAPDSEGRTGRG